MKPSLSRLALVALGVAILAIALTDTPSAAWPGQGWSSSGGAGGGSGSTINGGAGCSFDYAPGGTAGGNVYTTTPTVYAAIQNCSGTSTVWIDDSHTSPAVWAAGTYALDGVIFRARGNYTSYTSQGTGGATLQFAAGTTITASTLVFADTVQAQSENTSAPVISVGAGGILNLYVVNNAQLESQTAQPFANTTGTGFIHAYAVNFSGFGDATHATITGTSNTGAGGVEVELSGISELAAGSVTASGGGGCSFFYDAGSTISGGMTGCISFLESGLWFVVPQGTAPGTTNPGGLNVQSVSSHAQASFQDVGGANICTVQTATGDAAKANLTFSAGMTDGVVISQANQTTDTAPPFFTVQSGGAWSSATTHKNAGTANFDTGPPASGGSAVAELGATNATSAIVGGTASSGTLGNLALGQTNSHGIESLYDGNTLQMVCGPMSSISGGNTGYSGCWFSAGSAGLAATNNNWAIAVGTGGLTQLNGVSQFAASLNTSTTVINCLTSGCSVLYGPATSSNWNPAPTTMNGGLDTLAAHHFVAMATATQTFTTTTAANVTTIGAITMAASDTWVATWDLAMSYTTSGDYAVWDVTVPTGATLELVGYQVSQTSTGNAFEAQRATTSGATISTPLSATTTSTVVHLVAHVKGDGTHAGTIQLQGAQAVSGNNAQVQIGASVSAVAE